MEYKKPASTVDLIVENDQREILLIKRKFNPFKGKEALPGGFLDCDKENLEQTGIRELKEETGLIAKVEDLVLVGVYSDPKRDPRGHVIGHVYLVTKYGGKLEAGDDAEKDSTRWASPYGLSKLAFDHNKVIKDYIKWRKKR